MKAARIRVIAIAAALCLCVGSVVVALSQRSEQTTASVMITEATNYPTLRYQSYSNQPDPLYAQLFEYVELYNYSDAAVDLKGYTLTYQYNNRVYEINDLRYETNSILYPDELFVIAIYNRYAAEFGYKPDDAYWAGFCEHYSIDLPAGNRAFALMTDENGNSLCGGAGQFVSSPTVSSEMYLTLLDKKGREVCKVDMSPRDNEGNPLHDPNAEGYLPIGQSTAFQYIWNDELGQPEFLFCTGCFPYRLLDEQKPRYAGPTSFEGSMKDSAMRVMSYNILAIDEEVSGIWRTVRERKEPFFEMLDAEHPDIIGLQEVNYKWLGENDLAAGMAEKGYTGIEGLSCWQNTYETAPLTPKVWDLFNPIYYKADRLTLLDTEFFYLTEDGKAGPGWDKPASIEPKPATLAVFEDNVTGDRFVVINTHIATTGRFARTGAVQLLCDKGAAYRAKYGGDKCGIIIIGDHNTREGSEPYQLYEKINLVSDSKFLTTRHVSVFTNNCFNALSTVCGAAIDYCMLTAENFYVYQYDVIDYKIGDIPVSDHQGICVDLDFRSTEKLKAPLYEGEKVFFDPSVDALPRGTRVVRTDPKDGKSYSFTVGYNVVGQIDQTQAKDVYMFAGQYADNVRFHSSEPRVLHGAAGQTVLQGTLTAYEGSRLTVTDLTFAGKLYAVRAVGSAVCRFTNCTFDNTSGDFVYAISPAGDANVSLENCSFIGFRYNYSDPAAGLTGGAIAQSDSVVLRGGTFDGQPISETDGQAMSELVTGGVTDDIGRTANAVADRTDTWYVFRITGRTMLKATMADGRVYYNAVPLDNARTTFTAQPVSADGEEIGEPYRMTVWKDALSLSIEGGGTSWTCTIHTNPEIFDTLLHDANLKIVEYGMLADADTKVYAADPKGIGQVYTHFSFELDQAATYGQAYLKYKLDDREYLVYSDQ